MRSNIDYFKGKARRTLLLVTGLFAIMNLYGTVGFMIIEGAGLFDAFYMTVITITTVGYQEVFPLSHTGRVFAITAIYLGLVSSGFSVALLANLFFEETLLQVFRGRATEVRVRKLKNHFIVCGYGTTGQSITQELLSQGDTVIVIDEEPLDFSSHRCIAMQGDARKDEILRRAGVERARGLATTLSEDSDNVFVVLSAREINPNLNIVSRYKDDDSERKLKTAGANNVVSPYRMGGHRLALALTNPPFLDVLDASFQKNDLKVRFHHVKVPEDSPVINCMLRDSEIRAYAMGALIVAVIDKHGNTTFNPSPDYHLENAAQLLVLGDEEQVNNLRGFLMGEAVEKRD